MKILEVIFSLKSGGGEKFVVDIANEFSRTGHETAILVIRDIQSHSGLDFQLPFISPDVQLFYLNSRFPSPVAICKIIHLLKRFSPDVVHLNLNVLPYFFLPALLFPKIRFYHTIHNIASVTVGYPGQKYLNRFFYNKDLIVPVTISATCAKTFWETYRISSPACIYNGRSVPEQSKQGEFVREEIQRMKHHDDDCVFVQVASFTPQKNQVFSVRLFAELQKRNAHAILLLIGKQNGDYYRQVEQEMPDNVYYLGEKSNVGDYLRHSDYFLLTSTYEGLPISLLEAFAMGCVPVCSSVGGIPDVITDQDNGYLLKIDGDNVSDIATCFMSILGRKEIILPEYLRSIYESRYTMEICASSYIALFSES